MERNKLTVHNKSEIPAQRGDDAIAVRKKRSDDDAIAVRTKRGGKGGRKKLTKQQKKARVLAVLISVFVGLTALYAVIVCSDIPFIKYWRTIWIETAMTTKSHQWLATWFFPDSVISAVMSNQYEDTSPQPTQRLPRMTSRNRSRRTRIRWGLQTSMSAARTSWATR